MNEEYFETPELEGDMEVVASRTASLEELSILSDACSPCAVCGMPLGLPYVWFVFEAPFQGIDFLFTSNS